MALCYKSIEPWTKSKRSIRNFINCDYQNILYIIDYNISIHKVLLDHLTRFRVSIIRVREMRAPKISREP